LGKFLRFHEYRGKNIWISDILGITNMSFVRSLKALGVNIPKDELDRMASEKTQRGNFTKELTDEVIAYNKQELKYLYELIVKIHKGLLDLGWYPKHIYGVGAVASYLLSQHGIDKENFYLTLKGLKRKEASDVIHAAEQSFFGGYIYAFTVGSVNQRVYHYDLHSAYPSKMVQLPSLQGGYWEKIDNPSKDDIFSSSMVSLVNVDVVQKGALKNRPTLPVRYKSKVFYSNNVSWTYNVEFVKVMMKHPEYYDVIPRVLWRFVPANNRKPFDFLNEISDMKSRTDKNIEKVRYRLLKIGMNSTYGKLVQVLGGDDSQYPPFYNIVYGAAITGATRAQLLDAILSIGIENAVLAMTDSIFSLKPLPDELIGDKLGMFGEEDKIKSMVVVQTGLYFYETLDGKLEFKHRGVDFELTGDTLEEIDENKKHDEWVLSKQVRQWLKYEYLMKDMEFKQRPHFRKITFGRTPKGYNSIGKWMALNDVGDGLKRISLVRFLIMGGFSELESDSNRRKLYTERPEKYDLSKHFLRMGVHSLSQDWYLLKNKIYGHAAPWLKSLNNLDYVEGLENQELEQEKRQENLDISLSSLEGL